MIEAQHARAFQRDRALTWGSLVVLLTLLVFRSCVSFEFLSFDDPVNVSANTWLDQTPEGLLQFWRAPYAGLYAPVAYSWWWLVGFCARWPATIASVYHLANLGLYVACVIAVFVLLRRLVGSSAAAGLGAAFFAAHPLHVESVAWVTEAKGLLAALFSLLAILAFFRGTEVESTAAHALSATKKGNHARQRRPLWRFAAWWGLATAAFVLAMLSRPTAVSLPLILLALAWASGRAGLAGVHKTLALVAAWIALAAVVVMATRQIQPLMPEIEVPWWQRGFVAADAWAFYLVKLIVPWPLGPDYGRTPRLVLGSVWFHFAIVLPIAALLMAQRLPRRRVATGSWIVVGASLLPTLGLLPFAFQRFSTVADRYAFLAVLGPAWWMAACAGRGTRTVRATGWGLVLVFALLSRWQTGAWRNDETLYEQALRANPRSVLGHNGLGAEAALRGDIRSAVEHFLAAASAQPHDPAGFFNLANLLSGTQPSKAIEFLTEAMKVDPGYRKGMFALASLLAKNGREADAVAQLDRWTRAHPLDDEAWMLLDELLASNDWEQVANLCTHGDHVESDIRTSDIAREGRLPLAERLIREGKLLQARFLLEDRTVRFDEVALKMRAQIALAEGEHACAVRLARLALSQWAGKPGAPYDLFIQALESAGKRDHAAAWRRKLEFLRAIQNAP